MGSLSRGLWTTYSCSGDIERNYLGTRTVCFGSLLGSMPNDGNVHNKYIIDVFKPFKNNLPINGFNANATLLTLNELRNHIRVVKKLFDFSFKVYEIKDKFKVHVDINQPKIYHKYLLSWIRYTYEYPFNIACLDMHEMRKQPECRFISSPNLMLTTLLFTPNPRIDHCICNQGVPKGLTNAKLRERFTETSSLNRFYKRIPQVKFCRFSDRTYITREEQLQGFDHRKEVYLEMYYNHIKP